MYLLYDPHRGVYYDTSKPHEAHTKHCRYSKEPAK